MAGRIIESRHAVIEHQAHAVDHQMRAVHPTLVAVSEIRLPSASMAITFAVCGDWLADCLPAKNSRASDLFGPFFGRLIRHKLLNRDVNKFRIAEVMLPLLPAEFRGFAEQMKISSAPRLNRLVAKQTVRRSGRLPTT